jgi:hypothetical protein
MGSVSRVIEQNVDRGASMSLTVSPELLSKARGGPVSDEEFLECVRGSLPYAWSVVAGLDERRRAGGEAMVVDDTVPPDADAFGQLLRLVGSDAMRGAVERRFGVRLAFQNCHKVAFFAPGADDEYADFVSPRAQLLNQKPELVNC